MKVTFVSLPMADLCSPPLGLAQIVGYLNNKFKQDVRCYDLNIDFFYDCLTHEQLLKSFDYVQEYIHSVDYDTCKDLKKIRDFFEYNLMGSYLLENIELAVDNLKKMITYKSWANYFKNSSVIERSLKLFSARYYPTLVTSGAVLFDLNDFSNQNIKKIILDKEINPLIDFYSRKISNIICEETSFLGISINYFEQIIPAITLANIIKRNYSYIKIVAGGALFSSYKDRMAELAVLSSYFDGLIFGPGERSWQQILEKNSIMNIEGCWISTGEKFIDNGILRKPLQRAKPDFEYFILDKYLTPKVILPYTLSIGCYWGKCKFCAYQSYKDHLVNKSKSDDLHKQILKDFADFNKKYNADYFYMVDEAIPPSLAKKIAGSIFKRGLPYKWYGEMRFENVMDLEFLKNIKKGGCAFLLFGLESGCNRILDKMEKGTNSHFIDRILKDCGTAGIRTMPMLFFGFPTETKEEAGETVEIIKANIKNIQYFGIGVFLLLKNIPVHDHPDEYDITIIPNKDSLALYDNYHAKEGMSQTQAKNLLNKIYKDENFDIFFNNVLISRNHLIFLPIHKKTAKKENYDINLNKRYVLNSVCFFVEDKYDWFNNCFALHNCIYICNPENVSIFEISNEIKNMLVCMNKGNSLYDIIENGYVKLKEAVIKIISYLYKEGVIIEVT